MNVWLQITLGIVPFLIVLACVIFARKFFKLKAVITLFAAFLLIGASTYFAFTTETDFKQTSGKEDFYLLGKYMLEGDIESAERMLKKLYDTNIYDEQYTLYQARLEALKGQADQAAFLFASMRNELNETATAMTPEEQAEEQAEQVIYDEAVFRYLLAQAEDPEEYGILALDDEENATDSPLIEPLEQIHQQISDELKAMRDEDPALAELDSQINLLLDTNDMFDDYVAGYEPDERELRKLVRRFEELTESDHHALTLDEMKLARMKAAIMDDSLHKLPEMVGSDASVHELVILSELYVNGLARHSNFEPFVDEEKREMYERVTRQAEKVLNEQFFDESKRAREEARNKVRTILDESRHLALAEMKNQLQQGMELESPAEHSKLYLQLSKIENYLGNSVRSDEAMNKAFQTAPLTDDANYSEPMKQIMQVIHAEVESESLKQVPALVESAVHHALPIPVTTQEETVADEKQSAENASFEQYFTNYVSKKRAEITIGMIDTSQFPTIEARVQFGGDYDPQQIKNSLEVIDQGINIEDFTIEKVNYDAARIMLLTDNSGSMSDAVEDLRQAVTSFVAGMEQNEQVAIVTFDSSIRHHSGFASHPDALSDAINELGAYGGTAIFESLKYGLNQFNHQPNSNDVIIVMTDGMDSWRPTEDTIRQVIGKESLQKGITVYTLGLGSQVDTDYLESLATYGNGSFVYANDAESLRAFYDFIHDQMTNQYVLKFTAQNIFDPNRELTVRLGSADAKDTKRYQLYDDEDAELDEDTLVHDQQGNLRLYGLDQKMIARSGNEKVELRLHGTGFSDVKNLSLSFKGPIQYWIDHVEVVDDLQLRFHLPEQMQIGVYDLIVQADGETRTLRGELEISKPGPSKTIQFGPYTLTAKEVIEEGNETLRLRGNVRLNNYINFRGDVVLKGDPKRDERITLTDQYGSSVTFDPKRSKGLSKAMALLGINLNFSSFGTFNLYDDERNLSNLSNYRVDRIGSSNKYIRMWGLAIQDSSLYVYPDNVKIEFAKINLELPFQRDLMKYAGESPFTISGKASAAITPDNIALIANLNTYRRDGLKQMSVGKLPVQLKRLNVAVNTLTHDYDVRAGVGLPYLPVVDEFGFRVAVKGGKFDTIMLYYDQPFTIVRTPVPIAVRDFGAGIEGMSKVPQGAGFKETLLQSYLVGQFDVEAGKLSAYLPFLDKFLPDVTLVTFNDVTAKMRVRDFSLLFLADINLFGQIKLSTVDVRLGNFQYENYLLNIPSQEVVGMHIEARQRFTFDTEKVAFDFMGASSATFNTMAQGIWGTGILNYEVDWFMFSQEKDYDGNVWVGVHSPNGKPQFTILIKGIDLKKNKQKGVRVVFKNGSIVPRIDLY